MISETQLKKFIELFHQRFGVTLTNEQALEKAIKLLTLVQIVVESTHEHEKERNES